MFSSLFLLPNILFQPQIFCLTHSARESCLLLSLPIVHTRTNLNTLIPPGLLLRTQEPSAWSQSTKASVVHSNPRTGALQKSLLHHGISAFLLKVSFFMNLLPAQQCPVTHSFCLSFWANHVIHIASMALLGCVLALVVTVRTKGS